MRKYACNLEMRCSLRAMSLFVVRPTVTMLGKTSWTLRTAKIRSGTGRTGPVSEPSLGSPVAVAMSSQVEALIGTWRCDGRAFASPLAAEHPTRASLTAKLEFDGFWLTYRYEEKKTKDNPMPYRGVGYWGFDPAGKSFFGVFMDSVGG